MSITLTPQAAMRIASMAILGYDFLVTIPSEVRLYGRQKTMLRPSIACVLFILARYVGLIYICWVTFVFFSPTWTLSSCGHIAPIGAVLRGLVSTTSASVFVWRTWAIYGKPRWILIVFGVVMIPVSFFSYIPGLIQKPVVTNGGCTAIARGTGPMAAKWTFALVNLIFDTVACCLGTFKLYMNRRNGASWVSNILLADGLLYYVIAVAIQATNLAFLLSPIPAKQGTFLTFQTITTTILAQRIITSLSERTSNVSTSSNPGISSNSQSRTRDRSGSRGVNVFKRSVPVHTFQRTTTGDEQDLEMMKVEVSVASHIHTDDALSGGKGGHETDRKIAFTAN